MEKQEHEFVERDSKGDRRKKASERLTYVPLPTSFGSTEKIESFKDESVSVDIVESEKTVLQENPPEIGNDVEEEIKYLFDISNTEKCHIPPPELIGGRESASLTKISLPKISALQSDHIIEISYLLTF